MASHNHISIATDTVADDDEELRTGPVDIEGDIDAPLVRADVSQYPFINTAANVIKLNGDDWSDLHGRFAAIDDTIVSIVHIGDSHLQGDGATSRTRALLQGYFGSSGRGLIVPLKLARTNQPFDYTVTSSTPMVTASMMRLPYATHMDFTGVAAQPSRQAFDITISVKPAGGRSQEFDCVKVYAHGVAPTLVKATTGGAPVKFDQQVTGDTLSVWLHDYVTQVRLDMEADGKCTIHGFKLENSMMGVEYHVIGNNGARYDTYNKVGGIGEGIRALSPNLVIISLGANEAYGHISDQAFYSNIDTLVKDILKANPRAHVLLVTPGPCQKKQRGVYHDNTDVRRLRDVILQYGADNKTATYDWYAVAGAGAGSSAMLSAGLLSKDRIHNTMAGYILQGELFYDALIKAIEHDDNERN